MQVSRATWLRSICYRSRSYFSNFPKFCIHNRVRRKPRTSSHSHIYSCQAELKKAQGGIPNSLGCPWAAAKSPNSYCFMVAYGVFVGLGLPPQSEKLRYGGNRQSIGNLRIPRKAAEMWALHWFCIWSGCYLLFRNLHTKAKEA